MAYGYPKQFPDYVNLAANAEAEQAFPTEQPKLMGAPNGPFGLNGAGLDSAALAVYQALQNQSTPHNALGSFAQGLAGGLAGGRVRSMQSREAANAAEQKRVEREAEYRRRMVSDSARQMRGHQLGMIRDAAKEAAKAKTPEGAMVDIPGVGKVPATSGLGTQYLTATGKVPKAPPQRDPGLAALTDLSIQKANQEQADRASALDETARGIATFAVDPRLPAREPDRQLKINATNQFLASPEAPKKKDGRPYTHRELVALRDEADRFSRVMNTARPTQLRQSAVTAYEHLKQLEDYYGTWRDVYEAKLREPGVMNAMLRMMPKGLVASNRAILEAGRNGLLGPDAATAAAQLVSTGDPVRREVEMVFSSGYAPYEAEIRSGFKKLDEATDRKAFDGSMKAMRGLIRKRVEVATKALPFYGGEDNPYLLGVSPVGVWLQKESEDASAHPVEPTKPVKNGGKAAKYGS